VRSGCLETVCLRGSAGEKSQLPHYFLVVVIVKTQGFNSRPIARFCYHLMSSSLREATL
jgi:hypothetical protein